MTDTHSSGLTNDGYGNLLQALRKDLQLDATTDVLAGTTVAALTNDTASHKSGPWIAPTLLNAWTTRAGDAVGYLKDPLGFVHLKGRLITSGAASTAVFTLPVGYRPGDTDDMYAAAGYGGGTAGLAAFAVIFSANGNVAVYYAAGATDVGLGGINFLAEN